MKLLLTILLFPLLLNAQDYHLDTMRIASIEQHPAWELYPCGKKNCYVGLKIVAGSALSKKYLKCEVCAHFFQAGEELSFLIVYTDGMKVLAQFAHPRCIEDYQRVIKKE